MHIQMYTTYKSSQHKLEDSVHRSKLYILYAKAEFIIIIIYKGLQYTSLKSMGALSYFTGQIFEWPYSLQVAATCIQELSISQQKHSASSNISKLDMLRANKI